MLDTVIDATARLSVSSEKLSTRCQRTGRRNTLLGDELETQLPPTLTLPNLPPSALTIHPVCQPDFCPDPLTYMSSIDFPAAASYVLEGSLESLLRVTKGDAKVVYEASIHLSDGERIQYQPGDCVAILCENSDTDIEWLLARVDPTPLPCVDCPFTIEYMAKKSPPWLPLGVPVTLRFILTHLLELNVPATKRMTRILAECCHQSNEFSKRQVVRLLQLSSREGAEMFDRFIRHPNVRLFDLLNSFPDCRLTVARLLELLPRLRPRLYSLVGLDSDQHEDGGQILKLLFTLVDAAHTDGDSPPGLMRYTHRTHGVCTGWMERIWLKRTAATPLVRLYLRQNLTGFRAPEDPLQPLIMIASGTGLAPFISILRSRRQLRHGSPDPSNTWLIFGCRSPLTSFLMPATLNDFITDGLLHQCCLCFSRYPVDDAQPTLPNDFPEQLRLRSCVHRSPTARYVQHCIIPLEDSGALTKEQKDLAKWVVHRNATIMVCGEMRAMGIAVRDAWILLLARFISLQNGLLSTSEVDIAVGEEYFKRLRDEKRYLEDIWT